MCASKRSSTQSGPPRRAAPSQRAVLILRAAVCSDPKLLRRNGWENVTPEDPPFLEDHHPFASVFKANLQEDFRSDFLQLETGTQEAPRSCSCEGAERAAPGHHRLIGKAETLLGPLPNPGKTTAAARPQLRPKSARRGGLAIALSDLRNHPPPLLTCNTKKLGNYCGGEPRGYRKFTNRLRRLQRKSKGQTRYSL